jgi:hypothetical protein
LNVFAIVLGWFRQRDATDGHCVDLLLPLIASRPEGRSARRYGGSVEQGHEAGPDIGAGLRQALLRLRDQRFLEDA